MLRSLRSKLTTALLTAALLPLLAVGWRSARVAEGQSVTLAEADLTSATRLAAGMVDALVDRHLVALAGLAVHPDIAALAARGPVEPARRRLEGALNALSSGATIAQFVDLSGRPLASAGSGASEGPAPAIPNLTSDPQPMVVPIGDSLGLPIAIDFIAPVRRTDGGVVGAVHVRLPSRRIADLLMQAGDQARGNAIVRLRSVSGAPVGSYPMPNVGRVKPTAVAWGNVPNGFTASDERTAAGGVRLRRLHHVQSGYDLYEATLLLQEAPWYLAASVDVAAVLAPAQRRKQLFLAELLAVALLVAGIALPVGAGLSRRVQVVRDVTRRFAEGDRAVRAPDRGSDEIADLGRSVNAMADRIGTLVTSLEQRTKELEGDIAERHRLEAQLVQARKLEAIGQLSGGIAHDYNNALTIIIQTAESIAEDVGPQSPVSEDLASLRSAALQAAKLTQQLLTFARQQPVEPRRLDLNVVVREASGLMRRLLGSHRLVVREADVPLPVLVDPTQVTQVLLNLASNARDAFDDRTGTFCVTLQLHQQGESASGPTATHATLEATDDGVGIPPDVMRRIFDPFFTTKPPGRGTGLGLATVFGIVGQAGGSIDVTSAVGVGTTFRITLPLDQAPTT